MVINCVGKMICRYTIRFKKYNINYIFRHFNFAFNHIVKIAFLFNVTRRF